MIRRMVERRKEARGQRLPAGSLRGEVMAYIICITNYQQLLTNGYPIINHYYPIIILLLATIITRWLFCIAML